MDVFEEGIRRGYETGRGKTNRVGFETGQIGRRKVAPSELAAYNLYKILEKYPEFTKEGRMAAQDEFSGFNDLAVMNLETVASVLTFLKIYPDPTPEEFKDEVIVKYFDRLLPTKAISAEERAKLIVRIKAVFLKYIRAIRSYRASREGFPESVRSGEGEGGQDEEGDQFGGYGDLVGIGDEVEDDYEP